MNYCVVMTSRFERNVKKIQSAGSFMINKEKITYFSNLILNRTEHVQPNKAKLAIKEWDSEKKKSNQGTVQTGSVCFISYVLGKSFGTTFQWQFLVSQNKWGLTELAGQQHRFNTPGKDKGVSHMLLRMYHLKVVDVAAAIDTMKLLKFTI